MLHLQQPHLPSPLLLHAHLPFHQRCTHMQRRKEAYRRYCKLRDCGKLAGGANPPLSAANSGFLPGGFSNGNSDPHPMDSASGKSRDAVGEASPTEAAAAAEAGATAALDPAAPRSSRHRGGLRQMFGGLCGRGRADDAARAREQVRQRT